MAQKGSVTVGLVQMQMDADAAVNMKRAADWVARAARQGAEVVCLPEMYRTPYFCVTEDHANFDLAEPVPGPSTELFGKVAADNQATVIVPIFERRARGLFHNSLVVMGPDGKQLGMYRKMHIPDDPNFYEKFYFTPGDLGWKAFDTPHGKLGTLICWDQWYPEAARLTAMKGAEVIFYPTAIGYAEVDAEHYPTQRNAWQTLQRSHAIANGVFVAVANRVGTEGPLKFWGSSFICDPFGKVIAEASTDKEEVILAKCDFDAIHRMRTGWPFLRDRRIDAYDGITKRYLDQEA